MTIDDPIIDEELQYDIKRETAKILALSSNKIDTMNILLVKKCYHLINNK